MPWKARAPPGRIVNNPAIADWPDGVARHVLERVDSTNAEAFRLAPHLSGPAWIMARRQEAGRGRRGRPWNDPPGNFAATLVLRPTGGPGEAARLSFVAALALYDALVALCGPQIRLALKWPNDVLLNGGKLSGILLESSGTGGSMTSLAIGIGVNLAAAPESEQVEAGAMRPVSLLGETGLTITPEELLDALAPAFNDWARRMENEGFAPIRQAWMARAARLGETILARAGNTRIEGRFDGIDETGALILTTAGGRQAIPAAEIYFSEG